MTHRSVRIVGTLVAFLLVSTAASRSGFETVPPLDMELRLEALDPTDPRGYFELAEDLADRESEESRRMARRLFGLAGRLDPDKYASSAALGLAELSADARSRSRLRAAATMLPGGTLVVSGRSRRNIDPATAFEVSEAFGDFRAGKMIKLRRLLEDPAVRRLLESSDEVLPGGVRWLEESMTKGRQLPELTQRDQLAMLRFELMLLEGGRPSWSTLLTVEGDPALLEFDAEGMKRLLLDEETLRPVRRDGRWVER